MEGTLGNMDRSHGLSDTQGMDDKKQGVWFTLSTPCSIYEQCDDDNGEQGDAYEWVVSRRLDKLKSG